MIEDFGALFAFCGLIKSDAAKYLNADENQIDAWLQAKELPSASAEQKLLNLANTIRHLAQNNADIVASSPTLGREVHLPYPDKDRLEEVGLPFEGSYKAMAAFMTELLKPRTWVVIDDPTKAP